MVDAKLPDCFTISYKETSGLQIQLDLYLPPPPVTSRGSRPALVYFHGGGLTVGEKTSWFPFWLHDRAMTAGYAFISANYRLLPSATGHEMLEDIKDLFKFIENDIYERVQARGRDDRIDSQRIAVIGTSAGGLCAYLAGLHAEPKPKALLSMSLDPENNIHPYLKPKTPHYLNLKSTPFFRGRELLDPDEFPQFLYPHSANVPPTSSSPLSYHGADYPIPGYPRNPRMLLARLYLQLGNFIDYYTGEHEPSISERLRACLEANQDKRPTSWVSIIPKVHQDLIPQLNSGAFPPTFLIHGSKDTAVPIEESRSLQRGLQSAGVIVVLKVCDGMEHSFDYQSDAEEQWGAIFDEAFEFLKDHMSPG